VRFFRKQRTLANFVVANRDYRFKRLLYAGTLDLSHPWKSYRMKRFVPGISDLGYKLDSPVPKGKPEHP
jgi:hypothetical protein